MTSFHQRTTTFSFSNTAPTVDAGGIDEDDLLRVQNLLGAGAGRVVYGDGDEGYRRPREAELDVVGRLPFVPPAPTVARYREEMMEMVRRSGVGSGTGTRSGSQEPVMYELSLRDLVELPSAARALREVADDQRGCDRQVEEKQPPPPAEEAVGTRKTTTKEKPSRPVGKRDVFGGQAVESGVFMLKLFFFLPGMSGSSGSRSQRRKQSVARSKVTPAPKAIWCDEEKCDGDRSVKTETAWEDCRQAADKASRSSSGGGSEKGCKSSGRSRRWRRFAGCYSFLHATRRKDVE